uniref:PKD domain-containing protein n=1 Tax=Caenorhabditis tropicalis TaxID=1561998 RepID=A0A1I7T7M5_9PELO
MGRVSKYHRVKNSWAEEATSTEESNDNYTIVQTEMYDNQYCTGYNLLEGTEEFRDDGLEPITLTTHATSDMMRTLEKLLPMWDGPISVGVFVDYHSSKVLEYLQEVHRCDEEFRRKIHALCRANYTFHVLSHVFNVHEGIKLDNTIYSKATIDHQLAYVMEPIVPIFNFYWLCFILTCAICCHKMKIALHQDDLYIYTLIYFIRTYFLIAFLLV